MSATLPLASLSLIGGGWLVLRLTGVFCRALVAFGMMFTVRRVVTDEGEMPAEGLLEGLPVDLEDAHDEYHEQPITAVLAEAMSSDEADGAYAVDCSLTLACSDCGKDLCPGCGDIFIVSFFLNKASIHCKECVDEERKSKVKSDLAYYKLGVKPE